MTTFIKQSSEIQAALYQISHIKRRHRSTNVEVSARRDALLDITSEMQPMTVRQVFYQTTVRNLVEKTEAGYSKVQTDLVQMRRSGTPLLLGRTAK